MATVKAELKAILDKYGIDPKDKAQVWDCHGTLVLYHRAYEIIGAKEKIAFDPPTVIEGDSAGKTVALLVVGKMGDHREWSIGEAAPGNNKNSYPYAMAEKRAKDRVIAKLVGLAAFIYSEAEADDFKASTNSDAAPSGSVVTQAEVIRGKEFTAAEWKAKAQALVKDAEDTCGTVDALFVWQQARQGDIDEIRRRSRPLADWIAESLLGVHEKIIAGKTAA